MAVLLMIKWKIHLKIEIRSAPDQAIQKENNIAKLACLKIIVKAKLRRISFITVNAVTIQGSNTLAR